MKYNDTPFENKAFSFVRQLFYNIALAVCIILIGFLIATYGFKIQLYEVLSDSQYPVYRTGDLVLVTKTNDYKVGDILCFDYAGDLNVTHRIIYKGKDESGDTVYLVHGDALGSIQDGSNSTYVDWKENVKYLENRSYAEIKQMVANSETSENNEKIFNCQMVKDENVKGEVVAKLTSYGTYINSIKSHAMLFIAILLGIWCIGGTIEIEMDIRRARRFSN